MRIVGISFRFAASYAEPREILRTRATSLRVLTRGSTQPSVDLWSMTYSMGLVRHRYKFGIRPLHTLCQPCRRR